MSKDKFDFHVAESLVQVVQQAATALEIKNGQMEQKFGALHEGFKDSGYDAYACDMTAAGTVANGVITQLHTVAGCIAKYAARMRDEAR